MNWKVLFFQTTRGDHPVEIFIQKQDPATYAKILHSIELIKNYGPFLKPPHIKKIANDLFELRISGKKAIRIFYTLFDGQYYLLHAFIKKSQKTPAKEMKIAIDRMKKLI